MKAKKLIFALLLIITGFVLQPTKSFAQEEVPVYGAIKGVVLDKKTRKPLAGVNITVEGTRRGTTTNGNGEFTILKIVTGKYTLIFNYIGYTRKKYDNINIISNKTTDIEILEMEEQPIPLKEIVVTYAESKVSVYKIVPKELREYMK